MNPVACIAQVAMYQGNNMRMTKVIRMMFERVLSFTNIKKWSEFWSVAI